MNEQPRKKKDVVLACGWGNVIFAQTFSDNDQIIQKIRKEQKGKRDIIFYPRDPHVLIAKAPHEIFMDPSHTYRLELKKYQEEETATPGFEIKPLMPDQIGEFRNLYLQHHMIPPSEEFVMQNYQNPLYTYLVAVDEKTDGIIGGVLGLDHQLALGGNEPGSSLWALAVDKQSLYPAVGQNLVRVLACEFKNRGRHFMDLSVIHANSQAIGLYEKMGFYRIPVFALKRKNPYNEPLFIGPQPEQECNPYAKIIINEAKKRGIKVNIIDAKKGYFNLIFGGRKITCRESLSELTSAIAMSRCDDKSVTTSLLKKAGLRVPKQMQAQGDREDEEFLKECKRIVVKPKKGEQGEGVSVNIDNETEMQKAIKKASLCSEDVLLEEYIEGLDLRIIVINDEVVAAALRKPPQVVGTGKHSVRELIEKQSRRRQAATEGESRIPIDPETKRCVQSKGHGLEDVIEKGTSFVVRNSANLHLGGTIHDVTDQLHPSLKEVACKAARVLGIPVVGFDFIIDSLKHHQYVIIEANERPGLANHEPQPTAQRFLDLLFPYSKVVTKFH